MTDTAREAAIERVRAWVAENADKPDDYDTRDGDILLGDIRLLLTDPRQPSEAPVAWRVKDFADGWIVFDNKARAEEEVMATGALIQPLFASEPPVTADERLSELLTRALWEIRSQSCDGVISASASPFHASTYDEPLEDDIEQALSTYNQRTET